VTAGKAGDSRFYIDFIQLTHCVAAHKQTAVMHVQRKQSLGHTWESNYFKKWVS